MSAATSPSTQRPYGVQRVCRIWAMPRSTFYWASRPADTAPAKPRGPRPLVDDASLLAAIRADLAASPFSGEGHRKVWARLHYGLGLPVGRDRVLRLMRDNQLLSPFRRPLHQHRSEPNRKRQIDAKIGSVIGNTETCREVQECPVSDSRSDSQFQD
jgi:putative transposase